MRVPFYFIAILSWVVCVPLIVSDPRSAQAAEWSSRPSVRAGLEHNDNARLTIQPHNSVTGSTISPRLDLGVSSDIWQVTGSVEAVQKRFSGESGLDRDDRYYNLLTSYRTERSNWQVAGSMSKSSTLASEQINPDAVLIQVQKAYDTRSVNPSWTWAMNELTQLQLTYSFNSVSYVDGKRVGRFDYSTRAVSAQLTNQFDPKDQIFFSAGYSIFNVPATTFESKSALYQAGITRTFSETVRGTLSAGARKTSNEQIGLVCTVSFGPFCFQTVNATVFSKGSSPTFNGSLEKKYETTRLQVGFRREVNPSGLGAQIQTDSQNVTLSRQFSSKLTGNISARNYKSSSETGNVASVNSHFYTIEPGLHWTWMQEWSADLTYRYTYIKRAVENEPASSNATYLTVRYAWPRMSVSR